MTQAIAKPDNQNNLNESDLNLWLEKAIAHLKAGDLHKLDITTNKK